VDFITPQEAKVAMESLGSTHLYGRHLVIEWAKEDESVEEMRAKAAKSFSNNTGNKKRRIEMEDFDTSE
jgi:multiple RNA-binding domain-containing protein 1